MILERVRDALRAGHQLAGMPPVTASFGVVDSEDDELLDELFRRADALLFEAKHAGRDRVRVAGTVPATRSRRVLSSKSVELRAVSACSLAGLAAHQPRSPCGRAGGGGR